jgi:ATP-binding cassette, subfamily C (CFTR/MRP), member 1
MPDGPELEKEVHIPDQDHHTAPFAPYPTEPVDDSASPIEPTSSSEKDIEKELEGHRHAANDADEISVAAFEGIKVDDGTSRAKRQHSRHSLNRIASATSGFTTTTEYDDEESEESLKGKKKKWYKRLNPLKRSIKPPVPQERQVSREYTAGFFSLLTFQWMAPLMSVGYQRPLEFNDIWKVNPDRSAETLKKRLNEAFKRRRESGSKRPLVMALYDTFRAEFWLGAFCQLVASILQAVSPFVLRFLIQFATDAYLANKRGLPQPNIGRGIGLVIGISAMQVCQTLTTNHFIYRGMMVGGEARAVMIAVIFDKAMKISGRAKAGGKPAEIQGEEVEKPPEGTKPGSEDERKWYEKLMRKKRPDGEKEVKTKKGKGNGGKGDELLGDGQGWSNGRIINLMSTDTWRVDQASGMFHMTWSSPITIFITLALLLVNITYSALAGFALLVIAMPLLGKAMRSMFHRRVAINKVTDQRVSLTQEILSAVKFVKYFGWELSFLERISEIRKREIRSIQILLSIRNAILSVGMSVPVFASMLAFITYSLSNHVLTPAPIFSSLALFNSLRLPLNFLPMVLGQVVDALSSLKRIEEFLLAEEQHDDFEWNEDAKEAIVMSHASFTWERETTQENENAKKGKGSAKKEKKHKKTRSSSKEKETNVKDSKEEDRSSGAATPEVEKIPFQIHDMNFSVGRNELVAVIGTVGSGKSSLLAALAGDMRMTSGEVVLGASRAFCPQYAWIQNATVKENIVFGREFHKKWYDQVVDACALRPDLEMLPNGDLTEIGERGITVSGGQKQRLNIARAIYFDADIILMDDPLSAVDAHVGRHIMDKAICGLLKDKCRILATHQLHVLNRCDRIIWMQEGRIEAIDTFDNLMSQNEAFVKLMASTAVEKKDEDKPKDNTEADKNERKSKKSKKGPALMQVEDRAVKSVAWSVYAAYIKASGSWLVAPLVIILLIACNGANIVTSLWLSWWTSDKFHFSEGAYVSFISLLILTRVLPHGVKVSAYLYPSPLHSADQDM